MALTKCSDCGKNVSDTAQSCPHCGKAREVEGVEVFNVILGFIIVMAIAIWFIGPLLWKWLGIE